MSNYSSQDKPALQPLEAKFYIKECQEHSGQLFTSTAMPRIEAAVNYSRFRPDDVLIYTYPKAGTHFAAEVVKAIFLERDGKKCTENMNDPKYGEHGLEMGPPEKSAPENPLAELDAAPSPRIIPTHLFWSSLPEGARNGKLKTIHVLRNPKDVACSAYPHFMKMALTPDCTWDDYLQLFLAAKVIWGGYFQWLKEWYPHRKDSNILNLTFEDMIKDLRKNVMAICEFLEIDLNNEQIDRVTQANTFENRLQTADTRAKFFMNKGQSGTWKNKITVAQNEAFDEWIAAGLDGLDEVHIEYE